MRFLNAKKSAQNRKNRTRKQKRGVRTVKKGWPGGMRGGTGEGTLGEGAENFAENYA